jgi:P2-related tail formation protein
LIHFVPSHSCWSCTEYAVTRVIRTLAFDTPLTAVMSEMRTTVPVPFAVISAMRTTGPCERVPLLVHFETDTGRWDAAWIEEIRTEAAICYAAVTCSLIFIAFQPPVVTD